MKDYKLRYKYGLGLSKKVKFLNKIGQENNINAVYKYAYGIIDINLKSVEFRKRPDLAIINSMTEIITHELLHHIIYEETNTWANDYEEVIVEIMTGQREWGDLK